ncbi:MAG: M23 family metallopeptidase, partial [Actinomycetota bacterium]
MKPPIRRRVAGLVFAILAAAVQLIANPLPAAAEPSLKFPWDRAENPWTLTQGPHDFDDPHTNSNSGLDFDRDPGNNIVLSMFEGDITFAGTEPYCGNTVLRVQSADGSGWAVEYLHMSSFAVTTGHVMQGDILGYTGNVGCSSGEHLHVELFVGGAHASWIGRVIDGWTVPDCDDDRGGCPRLSLGSSNFPGAGGDRDGDGVPDSSDRCPDQPGPASNGGCPRLKADFNGDGISDYAIYRASEGKWFVKSGPSGDAFISFGVQHGGQLDDVPLVGDFNGDGISDYAIYRASEGKWFVKSGPSGDAFISFGVQHGGQL